MERGYKTLRPTEMPRKVVAEYRRDTKKLSELCDEILEGMAWVQAKKRHKKDKCRAGRGCSTPRLVCMTEEAWRILT